MSCICIITALPAESRVFIDALKLRQVQSRGIRLYGFKHHLLLQTGIGKLKAAAATAALLHARTDISHVINVGIAGGGARIGSVHLAHQIVDAASGASWFPHLPPQRQVSQLPTATVQSVDKPCTDYQEGVLSDMEAAGVYSAASNYLSTDAIQSIKVVSDNSTSSLASFNKDRCAELVEQTLPVTLQLCSWYLSGQSAEKESANLQALVAEITTKVHHTTNEQLQLQRQLQQLASLAQELPDVQFIGCMKTAKAIRQHLQYLLEQSPLTYGQSA